MNLKEVKELIDLISEKGFTEFEIERQGFRMRMSRYSQQPASQPASPVIALPVPPALSVAAPPTAATAEQVSGQPAAQTTAARPATGSEAPDDTHGLYILKSPLVGTFYRAPTPEAPAYVNVGDRVYPDTLVCIVEAMKLMNTIQAEVEGVIDKIYVENGQPVEYGAPLFAIKTS
jgi:acetyl-CoA carboxylase biotin carboxyl carrier protein